MTHRALRVRALLAAFLSVFAAGALLSPAAEAKPKPKPSKLTSKKLQQLTTPKGINAHLKRFQRIASAYGNRAAGEPGYDASAQYVFDTLKKAGYQPTFDEFSFDPFFEDAPTLFSRVSPNPQDFVDGTDYSVLEYGGSGQVTGELFSVGTLGCTAGDYPAGVAGKVALVSRGTCSFRDKVTNAAAAGATAIVIYDNAPSPGDAPLAGTLGPGGLSAIPGVGVSQAFGTSLENQVKAGTVTVNIQATTSTKTVTTRNVLAETKGGDANNVVVSGAHLDSVAEGAGINDNGSGSAALLEIARQVKKIGVAPRNKLRFAWWSAEESGLVGATDYVSRLTPEDQLEIGLYLNFDMVGSPNFARFIYDGDNTLGTDTVAPPGSDAIEANFERFFAGRGLATEPTAFDGRSDYGPFIDVGIPAGGLFTGAEDVKTEEQAAKFGGTAGVAFDPNYHGPGDTFNNVSQQAIDEQSDAIADSVALYANDTSSVDDQDQGLQSLRRQSAKFDYLGEKLVR